MKKIIYLVMMLAIAAFTSCEDVPAPYDDPNNHPKEEDPVDENLILEETFGKGFGSFEVITLEGTPWTINYGTATGTGYDSKTKVNTASKSYLVSGDIDLTGVDQAYIEFEYIFRYKKNDGENKVLITDDYKGDPTTTDWTDITGTLTEGSDWDTFYKYVHIIEQQFLGKNGIRIALYYSGTEKGSRTWEVKNLKIRKGEPEEEPGPELPTDLNGDGTAANPYDVASALKVIQAVGTTGTENDVYVKGTVTEVTEISTQNGNATFLIGDPGSTSTMTIYRAKGLEKADITTNDYVKAGDEVICCGKLVNFKGNTPEMTQGGYIYSLNGKTSEGSGVIADPTGNGTLEDPYNVAAAINFINSLSADVQSDVIYVKGKISKIKEVNTNADYGNATYWISDDGTVTNQLQVYRGYYLKNEKFTDANAIKVGDEVIVCGKVVNFKGNTPEFVDKASYIYSLNGDNGEPKMAGSHDAPLTIAQALAFGDAEQAWVKGYIVGVIDAQNVGHFSYNDSEMENSALPFLMSGVQIQNVYSVEECLVVQTTRGSDIRRNVHPAAQTLGCEVLIYGSLQDYGSGLRALKNTTYAEIISPTGETVSYGAMPE
ncbi:MAG: hypothetical protein IKX36_01620 [Prevotella sp.]|nr:hypothetical protein [Prevotella sp.]